MLRKKEKERPDIMEILKNIGLSEYNPYEIVKHTHGVSYNDFIWFRFPGEKLNCDLNDGNYWWNIIKRDHVSATHFRSDSHVAVLSS